MKKDLFAKLIDESLPMLRGTAYRILGNADDADDAVHTGILRLRSCLLQPLRCMRPLRDQRSSVQKDLLQYPLLPQLQGKGE